jgi:hypothetical protein
LKSIGSSEWLITADVPTLFLGAKTLTAAMLVPPSASVSAVHAMIIAGDGRAILLMTRTSSLMESRS